MLKERESSEEWIWRAINKPDWTEIGENGNIHYIKVILERGGHFLRMVVNPHTQPKRIVTLFFDRRLRRRDEA